ncbi:ABC transporter substrate-binding protein [Saccharopolyspora rhizosphaerae]|uniref:ABC transporter substrate-binding protein n=1 Tax=Saccharopolyspora rhizosphaerae TaxID=2492662 RepID=A0A426JRL2_9PSEU|nr:ABC transporter substrate-binding protein [Saccharopolyspora rhizosphaerae]RRO15763.1 ABC transporter substrate-binding protein [Saccharopolyspora rhizosphaerae]
MRTQSTDPGRRRVALALLLATASTTTACAPLVDVHQTAAEVRASVQAPTVRGGEATVVLDSEPDELDPTTASTLTSRQVFINMCEKLYDLDDAVRVVPQLATALPAVSPDGLQLTIPLKPGVRFNDGTPFDAEAVKRSLDRHRTLDGSARRTELSAVAGVDVVDPLTVRVRLSRPYAPLAGMLADRAGMVLSPAALDRLGEDFADNPVCVGPYTFGERVAQDRIVLRRSDFYYGRDQTKLDRLVYRFVGDDNVRTANLRSGEYDVMWEVPAPQVPLISREPGLVLLNTPSLQYWGINVNIRNVGGETGHVPGPLANDPRVREALALAIDRETLNEITFNGLYQPACGPIPDISEFATPKTQACPPYDLDRARRLLAEAGVRTPIRVEMTLANDTSTMQAGQVIQAMAAQAGFEVVLRPSELTTALSDSRSGNFQLYAGGWSGRSDPDGNIASFHTADGSHNYSGYSTPETDALIERAAAEQDPAVRSALYERVVADLQAANGLIYLYRQQYYTAHTDRMAGVTVHPDGLVRMQHAGFVEGS